MFKDYAILTKAVYCDFLPHSIKIDIKDILLWRRGFEKDRKPGIWYTQDEHIAQMCFPTIAKNNNSIRRSQEMNYECFIKTMAKMIKKYAGN